MQLMGSPIMCSGLCANHMCGQGTRWPADFRADNVMALMQINHTSQNEK